MDFNQFSQSCVKCGKCIPTCTIHQIKRDEINSPRGFLDLLAAYKEGNLELDKEAKRVFESCFLCTNCVEVCPSHIRVDNAIEAVRYDIAKKFGIAWYKRLLLYFLRTRKALDIAAKFGFVFQSCAFALQNSGMKARFSLPFIKKGRLLPSFKQKSFLNQNTEFIDNGGEKSVGFFVGCLANYFYIDSAKAVLSIAKELKINVDLMKEQVCCGAPHFFTGDFKSLESLAKKNVEYFEKKLESVEYIITPEATCSAMLSVDLEHFFTMIKEEQWAKRAAKIAPKIKLATWYFYEKTPLLELLKTKGKKDLLLTYHDPCHARKMQGVFKEPRALLGANYRFAEMSDSNACCGFGGVSMQSDYYENTLKVGLKKAKMIDESGASVVSAECSACKMQISNALTQNQSKVVFKSPLELIAQALKQ
ncbi:(Fe-S)-binding protein [Campylobacter upsaliensis]|uniref:(Fe-S)-binding protein n=1 Tax=Campylobacter upsaliensis TaxID=28080 RepID=UPI001274DC7E|nr:(Fe-S)-binding protein [Campylobacter upsaliensis]EAI5602864.1 (Fe-S)-binding protein [Campylobacter upsaliensis]EAJ7131730.1 (Fe-S)-binding protein [Campylobacter upsaliensis]EAK6956513.1 (Fe-S)-binding protein [Campylobacter upsaliensis]EAK9898196.1 (Fe-S)-binding protein [Campylobacter upsaliensis]EAL3930206.1 (Fe-S)-binding protein [Campylobacter upsaliensis]